MTTIRIVHGANRVYYYAAPLKWSSYYLAWYATIDGQDWVVVKTKKGGHKTVGLLEDLSTLQATGEDLE